MTKTEICNRALAVLGHDRMVDDFDSDQSTEALRCRQFYNAALEEVLGDHDWDFAAVEIKLRLSAADENGFARIPTPPDCLRLISATNTEGNPLKTRRARDFIFIKSDGCEAVVRYVSNDIDIETVPPKFREAFIYKLAALICGPMFGNDKKAEGYINLAKMKLSEAVTAEADETAYRGEWENPFINARR